MKGTLIKRISLFMLLFIMFFSMECIIMAKVYKTFYVEYFSLEVTLYLIFLTPILFFKSEKVTVAYASVWFGLFDLFFIANLILDYSSSDVFSIKYIVFIETATQVFSLNFFSVWHIVIFLGYVLVYVLFLVFIYRRIRYNIYTKRGAQAIGSLVALIIICLSFSFRGIAINKVETENKLSQLDSLSGAEIINFKSQNLKRDALNDYGMLSLYFAEINSLIDPVIVEVPEPEPVPSDDVDTAAAITYDGLLSGMNVLEIMIETGVPQGVSSYLTPNLFKLIQQGINCSRSYSKNKTNISEFIGIAGSTTSPISSSGYETPYSMAKILKDQGYTTTYLHNNYATFYGRKNVVTKLGFENTVFFEGDTWGATGYFDGNYPLDSDFVSENLDTMIPEGDTPFYTYWTSLSTHGPYNTGKINMNYFKTTEYLDTGFDYYRYVIHCENTGKWKNPCDNYQGSDRETILEQFRNFECELMNFDLSLGILLDDLVAKGKLDDTLIIFYGDHEAYYESNLCAPLKNYMYGLSESDPYYAPQYRTLLGFYNEKLTEAFYQKNKNSNEFKYFVTPYAIVPSTLELLGIEYDKSNYIGTSIFESTSDFDNVFYSHELKIIFTDKALTYDLETLAFDSGVSEEYKEKFLEYAQYIVIKCSSFNNMYEKGEYL